MENSGLERINRFELKYSSLAPDVVKNLSELSRTGWVKRGVKNPETVQEHIVAVRDLVISEMDKLVEFTTQEKEEILNMLEVHDWVESDSLVGDIVIITKDKEEKRMLKEKKFQLELEAMEKICSKLEDSGESILSLWIRFEEKSDSMATFANQVDKYQPIEKALEYEIIGENVSTQEFIDYAENGITHPILLNRLQRVKEKLYLFNASK